MPRYDVHQHLIPEPLVETLRARREPPRLAGGSLELGEGSFPFDPAAHDPEGRLELLDRDGIDVALLSLAPTLETEGHPELREAWHGGIAEVVARSGGRLRAFAAGECRPGFAGACVSAGALVAGLGNLPGELARAGQVLFVHPGPPGRPPAGAPPWWASVVDYTAQMQAAYFAWHAGGAERHPDLHVVFAVLAGGAPVQLERLRLRGPETPADARSTVHLDTASYGPRALALCVEALGPERLVYGSDAPVVDPGPSLRALAELGEATLETIIAENPGRLFP